MQAGVRIRSVAGLILCLTGVFVSCAGDQDGLVAKIPGHYMASPVLVETSSGPVVMLTSIRGVISALELRTGRVLWRLRVPAPSGVVLEFLAAPAVVDDKLVVIYQTASKRSRQRLSHRVLVVDVSKGRFDAAFPEVVLSARKPAVDASGVVEFNPPTALSRAGLAHGRTNPSSLGYVYASFGNQGDIQPWHGWVFELSMDRWQAEGAEAAISSVLLVTPETNCPVEGKTGANDMICGGGVWTPAGPQVFPGVT